MVSSAKKVKVCHKNRYFDSLNSLEREQYNWMEDSSPEQMLTEFHFQAIPTPYHPAQCKEDSLPLHSLASLMASSRIYQWCYIPILFSQPSNISLSCITEFATKTDPYTHSDTKATKILFETHRDKGTVSVRLQFSREKVGMPYAHMNLAHILHGHLFPEKSPMLLQSSQKVPVRGCYKA